MFKKLHIIAIVFCQTTNCCPDEAGWVTVGDSCYLVSPERMTWFGAQEFCFGHGGYIAEIKSEKGEEVLHHFLMEKGNYWIGLTDLDIEGKWIWATTHEVASYTNWDSGEPNNEGGEDCAIKIGNGWLDLDCDLNTSGAPMPIHALCEYDNRDDSHFF